MTEYMTAQEALAWVETGNAEFATSVANDGPHRYAISLAMWEQEKRGRARKTHRALRLLKERCASGRILAYARPIKSDRRELVKGADWIGLKLTMDFELATTHGTPLFIEPVFRRKDVLLQFPPPARESRPELSAAPISAPVGADDRTEASAIDAPPTIESWPDVEDKGAEGLPWFAAADDETGVLPAIEAWPEVGDKASDIASSDEPAPAGSEQTAATALKGRALAALQALSAIYPDGITPGLPETTRNDKVRSWLKDRSGVTVGDTNISRAAVRHKAGERA